MFNPIIRIRFIIIFFVKNTLSGDINNYIINIGNTKYSIIINVI